MGVWVGKAVGGRGSGLGRWVVKVDNPLLLALRVGNPYMQASQVAVHMLAVDNLKLV